MKKRKLLKREILLYIIYYTFRLAEPTLQYVYAQKNNTIQFTRELFKPE
jgi:hypothetical protein